MCSNDDFDSAWDKINIYDGYGKYVESQAGIAQEVVKLYAAAFCVSEIRNGGFLQFFWNNTGIVGPEALGGFKLLGLQELKAHVGLAMARLGNVYPRERRDRWDALLDLAGLPESELFDFFTRTLEMASRDLYLAFANVLPKDTLYEMDERFFALANEEGGGFDYVLDRYLTKSSEQRI